MKELCDTKLGGQPEAVVIGLLVGVLLSLIVGVLSLALLCVKRRAKESQHNNLDIMFNKLDEMQYDMWLDMLLSYLLLRIMGRSYCEPILRVYARRWSPKGRYPKATGKKPPLLPKDPFLKTNDVLVCYEAKHRILNATIESFKHAPWASVATITSLPDFKRTSLFDVVVDDKGIHHDDRAVIVGQVRHYEKKRPSERSQRSEASEAPSKKEATPSKMEATQATPSKEATQATPSKKEATPAKKPISKNAYEKVHYPPPGSSPQSPAAKKPTEQPKPRSTT